MSRPPRTETPTTPHITAAALIPVVVLTLVWGSNWPVLKIGVSELGPLTFRALTLPFAALGLLAIAVFSGDSVRIPRPLWGKVALLAIPLAALFSSLSVGLGVFARSTKEGQYYLLPIMLVTLPLSLYAMTPGVKLTPALSAIPISGLSMILQNLLAVSGEPISALSWLLGVGSLLACVALALAWAAWQFQRESVLFRGETGLTLRGWWKTLMNRDEEP